MSNESESESETGGNFEEVLQRNLEFTLVTVIVDAFMLWINARLKDDPCDYLILTMIALLFDISMPFLSHMFIFSQWIFSKRIYSQILSGLSQVVLWKKVSIVTLATVFVLPELKSVLLYYFINVKIRFLAFICII